jgi:SAM-dependent methyltransferase
VDFERACFLHDEARSRLLARLDYVRLVPELAVDLGCATGRGASALALRYPQASIVAIDSSRNMLRAAAARAGGAMAVVGGDAERLPLASHCADLVLANFVLPWCRPDALFAEAARVLADGGLLLFATLGPDTFKELREAFAAVDERIHVHAAFDMHDLGDLAIAAGLAEPVLDVDRLLSGRPRARSRAACCGRRQRRRRAPARPDGRRALASVRAHLHAGWGQARREHRARARPGVRPWRRAARGGRSARGDRNPPRAHQAPLGKYVGASRRRL